MKTGKIKSFLPMEKSKMKKAQLFLTIFLMKIMKKSPVMKLKTYLLFLIKIEIHTSHTYTNLYRNEKSIIET